MRRRAKLVLGAALVAAALSLAVVAAAGADPGVTNNSVLVGGTFPLSGPASAYGTIPQAEKAFFDWWNATHPKGVFGRKVDFKYYDDGYNPAQTVQLTRQLVEQDHVFAILNSLGTEHNLATRGYLNQQKVPQLFVATGASYWGTQWKQYPWTIGFQPDYPGESYLYGRYIVKNMPNAKIGVLMQNDDYGKDYMNGLKAGLGSKASSMIVDTEPYDVTQADVKQQVAKLKASGANVLVDFATPKFSVQAFVISSALGWNPTFFVNNVSATNTLMKLAVANSSAAHVNGAITTSYLPDPSDPAAGNLAGVKLYKSIMAKYYPNGNLNDQFNLYGMAVGWTFVQALQHAGKNPTRKSLMNAVLHLRIKNNPFLLKGIRITTSPKDYFPIQQGQLAKWDNGLFHPFGPIYSYR